MLQVKNLNPTAVFFSPATHCLSKSSSGARFLPGFCTILGNFIGERPAAQNQLHVDETSDGEMVADGNE
jgi:hypothetical protein